MVVLKLLDCALDSSTTGLDLCNRAFGHFTFPVEQVALIFVLEHCHDDPHLNQVQTVYRLLGRAEPLALERLCLAITVRHSTLSLWIGKWMLLWDNEVNLATKKCPCIENWQYVLSWNWMQSIIFRSRKLKVSNISGRRATSWWGRWDSVQLVSKIINSPKS